MNRVIVSATIVFTALAAFGQPLRNTRISKLEIGFAGIGLAEEFKIRDPYTLELSAGFGGGYRITYVGMDYRWYPKYPSLFVKSHFKLNYKRRNPKNREHAWLNQNFIGVALKFSTKTFNESEVISRNLIQTNNVRLINVHWGIQRILRRKMLLTTYIGIGSARDFKFKEHTIYPALELKLSYLTSL